MYAIPRCAVCGGGVYGRSMSSLRARGCEHVFGAWAWSVAMLLLWPQVQGSANLIRPLYMYLAASRVFHLFF
jgi:hypothetical protein